MRFTTPALTTQGSMIFAMNPLGITHNEYGWDAETVSPPSVNIVTTQ